MGCCYSSKNVIESSNVIKSVNIIESINNKKENKEIYIEINDESLQDIIIENLPQLEEDINDDYLSIVANYSTIDNEIPLEYFDKERSRGSSKSSLYPEEKEDLIEEEKIDEVTPCKIALKAPHGERCIYATNKSSMWSFGNINEWLSLLYKDSDFKFWIVYNNQWKKDHATKAHSKGIIAWNDKTFSYLVHSVPEFPSFFDGKTISRIEKSELLYGQSFIYIDDINISYLDKIIVQLNIMNVNVINTNIKWIPYKQFHVKTGQIAFCEFISHVAKSKEWGKDIYQDMLADESICYVQSWIRGHEIPESDNVKNMKSIRWPDGTSYHYTQDHSKFCVSDGWISIGDINRMSSQFHRGGSAIVVRDANINILFSQICVLR